MQNQLFTVDSFSSEPFRGNPAGVLLLDQMLPVPRMQAIAREINYSETAFVVPDSKQSFRVRYFSPVMEIPLCGHATLASAKVLFELHEFDHLQFHTIEELQIDIRRVDQRIEMTFPVYSLEDANAPSALLDAIGVSSVIYCGINREKKILMLEIESCDELKSLTPDFQALLKSHDSISGLLVTAKGQDEYDFHSRYFWPWSGGEEDPVTGGTHTFLAPYWAEKTGKRILKSFQSSRRTGEMEVEIAPEQKLLIRGDAVLVVEGKLRV